MLHLAQDEEADQLLSDEPLALLIGLVLDQQIPLERAFAAPLELKERLGGRLGAAALAGADEGELAETFRRQPALHRFPASMARRVQALARAVVEEYGGEAGRIWQTASSGRELLGRLERLPGFGEQKAKIFLALLGKQLEVRPAGWEAASAPFGEAGSALSIADIDSKESLHLVRQHKAEMKAAAKKKAAAGS